MTRSDGKEPRMDSDEAQGGPAEGGQEGAKGKADKAKASDGPADEPADESSDLVVQHWQAPNPSQLRGSSREIWEYENEGDGPSKELVITLVVIVVGLLGALGYMGYVMYSFLSSPP